MNGKIIAKTNRLIWLDVLGTSRLFDYMPDGYLAMPWSGPKEHRWTKHPGFSSHATKAFSQPNAIVFDPFTGGGTVPAVCKMLQRRYLAFEIDPDTAELARERVRNTQPPLPLEMPTQEQLI
jgi:hypothetical protein